ncbi:phosphotransferase [Candidatus Gracilibacteria bacterium]|nr:phosphotransferase [Candidatus Gracilibacteria bacterium]MCF7898759.1 phosphotransferase [Candidatus Paceibacterota bacterium]
MSIEQTLLSTEEVNNFLEQHHKDLIMELHFISGGKHSEAFSYSLNEKNYIVRFNKNNRGFLKDLYAYEHFSSEEIVIPKIYNIGNYNDDIFYCTSEKIEGETPKEQYKRDNFTSLYAQFEMIEKIKDIEIPKDYTNFGEFEIGLDTTYSTFDEYLKGMYQSKNIINWETVKLIPYFNQNFLDYLIKKIETLVNYSGNIRELTHGDFGNDNLFIKDGKISGIIDWERARIGDHFLDVGRVVLFCPNREATVKAVLDFYKDKNVTHYKERITLGVYVAMLRNYGAALSEGKEGSCRNYSNTIKQFEDIIKL